MSCLRPVKLPGSDRPLPFTVLAPGGGVLGNVVEGQDQGHLPGYRGWTKIGRRDSTESVVGAVTGTLARP